jgi:hypothetical protein
MEMRDPVAGPACKLHRVSAADDAVAGVESDLHDLGVGRLEQRSDLLGPFEVRRRVGMEGSGHTGRAGALGRLLDP